MDNKTPVRDRYSHWEVFMEWARESNTHFVLMVFIILAQWYVIINVIILNWTLNVLVVGICVFVFYAVLQTTDDFKRIVNRTIRNNRRIQDEGNDGTN